MSDAWKMFRDFVERTEDLPISLLVRNACKTIPATRSPPPMTPVPRAAAKQGTRRNR